MYFWLHGIIVIECTNGCLKIMYSSLNYNINEAPLVRGLAADGTISVSRDGWTILNKYILDLLHTLV